MNINGFIFTFALISCTLTQTKNDSFLWRYNFSKPEQFKITNKLKEVSGLASSKDGKIFAINDEMGIIYKLDPVNGKVIKRFFLGKWTAEADFEGIAVSDEFIFAITSNGNLYKFKEGNNNKSVEYEAISLPFSSKFNIEGLFFDKNLNGLLIVPKEYSGKKYKNERVVYLYSLSNNELVKDPILKISIKKLKKEFKVKDFYPSGITKIPSTDNYLIISAKNKNVIIEITSSGKIIDSYFLDESIHNQPEGVTILGDSTLVICDEGTSKRPTLTRYNLKDK